MSANPSTTASFIVTFMDTLGNFITWLGTKGATAFNMIGDGVAYIAELLLKMFNIIITGITSMLGKAGDRGADVLNKTALKETNVFVNFIIGIKDCFMYYLISPLFAMLNIKNASVVSVIFLILFIICIIGIILYVLFYFMTNIDTASKSLGIMFIVAVLIISVFLILYRVKQSFNPSSDNSASSAASSTLYNKIMVLIAIFICILIFVYANPLKQTLDELSAFPVTIISIAIIALLVMSYNKFYFNKYSIQLAAFIVLVAMGIYYNPFSIFTTHVVPSMIMIVTVISILILFMTMQQTTQDALGAPENGQLTFITVLSYAMVAGLMIGGGIYANEHKTAISDPVFYILLVVTLAIIYKAMLWTGYTRNIPIITLLFDVIFYIPCILVDVIDYFSQAVLQTYSITSKTMVILLVIEVALLMLYLIVPYMKNKLYKSFYIGGNAHLLVNSPMRVNSEHVIASFVELNCPDLLTNDVVNPSDFYPEVDKNGLPKLKLKRGPKEDCKSDYNYGLSMWFNMDAISPSAGAAYNEDTQIFKYGNKMVVKYNPSINTLTVNAQTLKSDNDGSTENDERNEVAVVYKNENVMLQKWNHLVINYSSGYVDVFLNGKLDGAKIQILPFMRNDSLIVGTGNGISGKVTGLIYFKHPMSAMSIKYMYEKFKTETPPKFPEDVSMFSTDIYKNSTYKS